MIIYDGAFFSNCSVSVPSTGQKVFKWREDQAVGVADWEHTAFDLAVCMFSFLSSNFSLFVCLCFDLFCDNSKTENKPDIILKLQFGPQFCNQASRDSPVNTNCDPKQTILG